MPEVKQRRRTLFNLFESILVRGKEGKKQHHYIDRGFSFLLSFGWELNIPSVFWLRDSL